VPQTNSLCKNIRNGILKRSSLLLASFQTCVRCSVVYTNNTTHSMLSAVSTLYYNHRSISKSPFAFAAAPHVQCALRPSHCVSVGCCSVSPYLVADRDCARMNHYNTFPSDDDVALSPTTIHINTPSQPLNSTPSRYISALTRQRLMFLITLLGFILFPTYAFLTLLTPYLTIYTTLTYILCATTVLSMLLTYCTEPGVVASPYAQYNGQYTQVKPTTTTTKGE